MLLFDMYELKELSTVKKIRTMSNLLSFLFRAACWVYPVLQIYCMFFRFDEVLAWVKPSLGDNFTFSSLSFGHHVVIFAISCLPMFMTLLICQRLSQLFRLYGQGFLFEIENIKLIKSIGVYIIAGQFVQLIYQPLMMFAVTFYKPAGEHLISFTISTTNFAMLITGFVVLTASWIVQEAHELKLDTELTF